MESLREVEFRDGKRWIPAYLADLMGGLKTHTLTYDEAVAKANTKIGQDHINTAYDQIVGQHFRGGH